MSTVKVIAIDRTRTPADIKSLSTKKIGSVNTQTGDVLRGLSMEEEKYYLPQVISVSASDINFARATKMFWADMSIVVDPEEGDLVLDISGTNHTIKNDDGTEVIRFVPNNIMDWLKYRFCQKHPRVAFSEKEVEQKENSRYGFYIFNEETQKTKEVASLAEREKADMLYLKLFQPTKDGKVNTDKVDWVIDLYRTVKSSDPNEKPISSLKDIDDKKLFLYNKKGSNPEQFVKMVSDELLEEKAFVTRCIDAGLLQRVGNSIVFDQDVLGESLKEACLSLKSESRTKMLLTLREQLKATSATV